MTPRKTKRVYRSSKCQRGLGARGDVVVCGDEERDPSDHDLVYACAEMGESKGEKANIVIQPIRSCP